MTFYPTLIVLHILSAGIWLAAMISAPFFNKAINSQKGKSSEKELISLSLIISNIIGSLGSMGLLITGIIIVVMNPGYDFFSFSANHWLVSKQIIMLIILFFIFGRLIPSAKKTRLSMVDVDTVGEETHSLLKQVQKITTIINVLVILNLFFALTHRFFG